MKKNIFLDVEGTLYVLKNGYDYTVFWDGQPTLERALDLYMPDAGVIKTLKELKQQGFRLVVVSMHREELLPELMKRLGLLEFFTDVLINGNKGERIREYIRKYRLDINECVMIGDRPELDIEPVREMGVDAVLIDRPYNEGYDAPRIATMKDYFKGKVIIPDKAIA